MAITAMKKVQVVTLKEFEKDVVSFLQDFSAFEPQSEDQKIGSSLFNLEKTQADIDFAIRFLSPFANTKRGFSFAFMGEKELMTQSRVHEIVKQFPYQELVEKAQELEVERNHILARQSEIQKELTYLSVLRGMNINPQDFASCAHVCSQFSRVKKVVFPLLKSLLEEQTSEFELSVIQESETEVVFFIVYHTDVKALVDSALRTYEVSEIVLPSALGNIEVFLESLENESEVLQEKLEENTVKIQGSAVELPKLKACYDYFLWEKERMETSLGGLETDYTVNIIGWIEADKLRKAELELAQKTQGSASIIEIEALEGEEAPVEIKNNSIFAPFEVITRMYGLPRVNELDPTPFLAVFFLVFFGFCLTDMLYGFLLAALSFSALAFMKVPREMKGLLKLVGVGGISTGVLGVVFGGYAGIPIEYIPSFLADLQQFDTSNSDDIIKIMSITFGLGFFQLWFGTLVAGFHNWKSGKKAEAFSLHFSWTIFFALIAYALTLDNDAMSKNIIIASVLFISLMLSYKTKNVFAKLIMGPFNLIQEIIAWGSGILSYARLFALGLATGVIATVFNQIATIMSDMVPPIVGIPLMIAIILFGHVLNIAINVLGAFIHSARLQFVEFFGKFMEGGGRKFQPLTRKSVYVYLEDMKS